MQRIIHAPKLETNTFEEMCTRLRDDSYQLFLRRLKEAEIILFDMDGTIIDSEPVWKEIHRKSAKDENLGVSSSQLEKLVGLALVANKDKVASIIGKDDPNPFINRVINYGENTDWEREIMLMPGIGAVINAFDAAEKPRAIVTSSEVHKAYMSLGKFKLDTMFMNVYGRDVTLVTKPEPGAYKYALDDLGIDRDRTIAIEDTLHGVQSAVRAGIYTIYVPSAEQPEIPTDNIFDNALQHDVGILCVASHYELLNILDVCLSHVPPLMRDVEWYR